MARNIVAGNWKMNLLHNEAMQLFTELRDAPVTQLNVEVIVAPPSLYLSEMVTKNNSKQFIQLAAQNVCHKPFGAFTGEISAAMLKSIDVNYSILGHSERRQCYGETNEIVAEKVQICLENHIKPIICVGEMLDERYADKQFEVVSTQLQTILSKVGNTQGREMIIAYEPVWAIGTGQTATAEQAQEMHAFIRQLLTAHFGLNEASQIPILYGGSCNAKNAKELFAQPDVNGGLVGGASLHAADFLQIIASF